MKENIFKLGDEILITDGAFRGMKGMFDGVESGINNSYVNCSKAKIYIDNENTITVPVTYIKKLKQDYLILITNRDRTKFIDKPYIFSLQESEVHNYITKIYYEVCSKKGYNSSKEVSLSLTGFPLVDILVSAIPTSSVRQKHQIEGIDISTEDLIPILKYMQ